MFFNFIPCVIPVEAIRRALLRWLLTRLHRVQIMHSREGSPSEDREALLISATRLGMWHPCQGSFDVPGCCIKVFSRKQECLSLSAQAELCAMKTRRVGVVGNVVGIHFGWDSADHFRTPQCTTGTYYFVLRNDATAAITRSGTQNFRSTFKCW